MSFLKNTSFTFSAQIVNAALSFIYSIYLTRILGAEGRGMYAIFINALAFSTIFFGFSINATVVYFINSYKIDVQKLLTTLLLFSVISTLSVFITLLILEHFDLLYLALPENFQQIKYLGLFGILYFSNLLTSILVSVLTAYKKFKLQSLLSLVPGILSVIIYTSIYYALTQKIQAEYGFALIFFVTLGIAVLNLIILISFFIKDVSTLPGWHRLSFTETKLLFTFSFIAYLGNLFQFLSYRLDFWLVDFYLGKSQLGIYSLATALSQLIWLLPRSVAMVLYPYAASASAEKAIRYTVIISNIVFYGCLILIVSELIFFYKALPILYGQEFTSAYPILSVLMIGIFPFAVATVVGTYFASLGKYRINLVAAILGVTSCFIFYPIFINKYGLFGAAIASNLSYTLSTVYLFWEFYRLTGTINILKPVGINEIKKLIQNLTVKEKDDHNDETYEN